MVNTCESWGGLDKVDFDALPHGKFAKIARIVVDPLWGIDPTDIKCLNVTVEGEVRQTHRNSYDIKTLDIDKAKRRALEMYNDDYEDVCFSEVISVTPIMKETD